MRIRVCHSKTIFLANATMGSGKGVVVLEAVLLFGPSTEENCDELGGFWCYILGLLAGRILTGWTDTYVQAPLPATTPPISHASRCMNTFAQQKAQAHMLPVASSCCRLLLTPPPQKTSQRNRPNGIAHQEYVRHLPHLTEKDSDSQLLPQSHRVAEEQT